MTYRSARSRRRALRRGITEFPAVLSSLRPGIRFTTTITAYPEAGPSGAYDPDALADQVRLALRAAAADAVRHMDPRDLPAAQDACARSLRRSRRIDTESGLEVRAECRLTLASDDDEAVRALLEASRKQGIQEALTRQRNRALVRELAHPAGVFAWWLQQAAQPAAGLPDPPSDEVLRQTADRLRNYPLDDEEPFEAQLLEVLRDFLTTFSRNEQKRMLLSLLADGMRAARQPEHAVAIEVIAAQNGTGSSGPGSP
ncbi:hypothetical protein [Streptomyces sp. NPDC057280]|uniref:hypothetical protein n=1 Tax=Streptomyces sp. NPDC057280 TaxID=3346081 RepID=UPI003627FA0B